MTTITIEAPGLDPLTLTRADGYIVRLFDFAAGSWRDSVTDAPNTDGTIDTTTRRGAGAITIGLRLQPWGADPTSRMVDRLRAFTHGRLRPTITIDYEDGSAPRFATVSRGVITSPIQQKTHRDAALAWQAPNGILESVELHQAAALASGSPSGLGRAYDLIPNRAYPTIDPEGSQIIVNAGNTDAYPLIRLYGPFSGEASIINDLTGERITIDGETVPLGSYIEFDTRSKTVLLNSDPTATRYHRVVFPTTTWFTLAPGEQRLRFVAETFSPPAQAEIWWRDAYV